MSHDIVPCGSKRASTMVDFLWNYIRLSDLGYSYLKEKSALRGFLELVIGTLWGIWIWWITLLPQIAFDHRPGGYACHLAAENWVSCQCFGTLAASLCDRLVAVIVCFYILRTIMKGKEPNILYQLSGILAMHFTYVPLVYFGFYLILVVVWNSFYFHPYLGKWSNLTNTFLDWLKPPTSYAA